jgi:hypothetical protein
MSERIVQLTRNILFLNYVRNDRYKRTNGVLSVVGGIKALLNDAGRETFIRLEETRLTPIRCQRYLVYNLLACQVSVKNVDSQF